MIHYKTSFVVACLLCYSKNKWDQWFSFFFARRYRACVRHSRSKSIGNTHIISWFGKLALGALGCCWCSWVLSWAILRAPGCSLLGDSGCPGCSWVLLGSPGVPGCFWVLLGASGRSWVTNILLLLLVSCVIPQTNEIYIFVVFARRYRACVRHSRSKRIGKPI